MKANRTWVLIADGARARILESDGAGAELKPSVDLVFGGDHRATHDLVGDREGRTVSSHASVHSAIDARSDPHRELKRSFAHQFAEALSDALERDAYDRLVLIAAPVTLGDLRAAISSKVAERVIAEIAKDLTKIPNAEIPSHLRHVAFV